MSLYNLTYNQLFPSELKVEEEKQAIQHWILLPKIFSQGDKMDNYLSIYA